MATKRELRRRIEECRAKKLELATENKRLNDENKRLNDENVVVYEANGFLNDALSSLRAENTACQTKKLALAATNVELNAENESLLARNNDLQAQVSALETLLDECRLDKGALSERLGELIERLEECEAAQEPPPPPTTTYIDLPSNLDPIPIWKGIGADRVDGHPENTSYSLSEVSPGRVTLLAENGMHFRRLKVMDGDEHWGERTELGNNSISNAPVVYREGERWLTEFEVRLAPNWPIASNLWQIIMQMKQVKPYVREDTNGSPILALEPNRGRWNLKSSGQQVLEGPPVVLDRWTKISLDVTYTKNIDGWLNLRVDDWAATYLGRTLKRAAEAGKGYDVGDPIPSSLRIGPYHAPELPGTYADFRRVNWKKI